MLVLIDNYDSFTYNLVHYLGELGATCQVFRNDKISVAEVLKLAPKGIVLSPGPCTPNEAGICLELAGLSPRRRNVRSLRHAAWEPNDGRPALAGIARPDPEGLRRRHAHRGRDPHRARPDDGGRRHAGADGRLSDGAAGARGDGGGDHRRRADAALAHEPRRGAS